jgi:Protein of unknown function (DUF1549)
MVSLLTATAARSAVSSAWKAQLAERSRLWSLQQPRNESPPQVNNDVWSKEPVDRFVLTALDRAGLSPAEPADTDVMSRRLAFVLTGLRPNLEQVVEFSQAFTDDADTGHFSIICSHKKRGTPGSGMPHFCSVHNSLLKCCARSRNGFSSMLSDGRDVRRSVRHDVRHRSSRHDDRHNSHRDDRRNCCDQS